MPIQPRYVPKDMEPQSTLTSICVLRTSDNEDFVAAVIPGTKTLDPPPEWEDPTKPTVTTPLAPVLIPTAATSLARLLNHPNVISLVDIIERSGIPGPQSQGGMKKDEQVKYPLDFTVWEDMNAGCLSYLLPSTNALPNLNDEAGWRALASQSYNRFSLPESLCWHVLQSISKALLWLHHGVKETEGIRGDWMKHDDDWQPVLIRDVSPGQIWFKHPKKDETYGECKLGGFQWAKVTGCPEGRIAIAPRFEDASLEKQYYWAPEIYKHTHSHCRKSEIWSLGAVIYTMMTGIPPPRYFEHNWQISRMNDKGFSEGLRDIVGNMLSHSMARRPDTLTLVSRVEEGWQAWRATTKEGQDYLDVRDEYLSQGYKGARETRSIL